MAGNYFDFLGVLLVPRRLSRLFRTWLDRRDAAGLIAEVVIEPEKPHGDLLKGESQLGYSTNNRKCGAIKASARGLDCGRCRYASGTVFVAIRRRVSNLEKERAGEIQLVLSTHSVLNLALRIIGGRVVVSYIWRLLLK